LRLFPKENETSIQKIRETADVPGITLHRLPSDCFTHMTSAAVLAVQQQPSAQRYNGMTKRHRETSDQGARCTREGKERGCKPEESFDAHFIETMDRWPPAVIVRKGAGPVGSYALQCPSTRNIKEDHATQG
jgi:hypothetical protein